MANTILVVEDEVLVARDITARLGRMGYEVVGNAARGEDAVSLALENRPVLASSLRWSTKPRAQLRYLVIRSMKN